MKATDVFTPGRLPTVTYIDEHLVQRRQQLLDTLDAGSMLVSISGPSKSGKTVFVEQTLGKENVIAVTGAGVKTPTDLWVRIFDIIGTPVVRSSTSGSTFAGSISATGGVEGGIIVAKGKAEVSGGATYTSSSSQAETMAMDPLQLLIKELRGTGLVIFIDDFHYVPRDVQVTLAQQIKEAIRNDIKVICASVPYHADDVIRGNPDLRGRVFAIDFDYWTPQTLEKIAYKGFKELGIIYRTPMVNKFAAEAAGSPQLMQYLCLNACYELGVRETPPEPVDLLDSGAVLENICRRTALSADYGSVVEKMKEGPKTRGASRNVHTTRFGWKGDVYRLLAKALSLDPPQLTFRYAHLIDRIAQTCSTDESPSGSSVTSACYHAATIVNDAVADRVVEWDSDNDVFDIRDPYFLFYLRWSDVTDK